MLDSELMSIASKEYDPRSFKMQSVQGRNTSNAFTHNEYTSNRNAQSIKKPVGLTEACTLAFLQNGRNQLYGEAFNIYDPNLPFAGKKRFNENFRPLRTKINLQIDPGNANSSY